MTLRRVAAIVAAWALLVLVLWTSHSRPAVLVLAGIVAAIGATLFLALDLADVVDELQWTPPSKRYDDTPRSDPRVSRLRNKVQSARWSGSTEIRDTLIELADDRLLAHHHLDRAHDPVAAAAVLGPALRDLIDGRGRTSMTPHELQRLLTEIEAL